MRDATSRTPVDILLIEDNPEHVYLLKRVLAQSRMRKTIHVVDSGEDALHFLRREGAHTQAPRPHLILLDLYLPRMQGLDVLKQLNQDPALRAIPVIILTGSTVPEDVLAAYDDGARAFITKPNTIEAFESVVQAIEAFWLATAKLPED